MTSESIASQKYIFVFMPKKLRPKIKKFQDSLLEKKLPGSIMEIYLNIKLLKLKMSTEI